MNTHAIAFTAGAATAGTALFYAGLHGPAGAFAAGVLVSLIAIVGVLSSRKRIRAVASLLTRIAGPDRTTRATAAPVPPSQIETEVTAALVQLGAKKPAAATAARQAAAQIPGAGFDSLFRAALPLCNKAA